MDDNPILFESENGLRQVLLSKWGQKYSEVTLDIFILESSFKLYFHSMENRKPSITCEIINEKNILNAISEKL